MAVYINNQRIVHGADKPLNTPIVDYVCDTPQDINNLPGKDTIKCGSTAFVISTSEPYMLGTNGWKKI
jgi:hypothetical protein